MTQKERERGDHVKEAWKGREGKGGVRIREFTWERRVKVTEECVYVILAKRNLPKSKQ